MTPAGTGKGVVVALLDTGVNPWHSHVNGVAKGVAFTELGDRDHVLERDGDSRDVVGHGTALAGVIRLWAPDATLLSGRILGDDMRGSLKALLAAIAWASREGAHVINLSLGTRNAAHRGALEEACGRARERGAVLVAAFGRDGEDEKHAADDLPAAIQGVLSVGVDPTCSVEGVPVRLVAPGPPLLRASPYPRDLPGVPRERNFHGPSVATAHVSGLAARILEAPRAPSRPPPQAGEEAGREPSTFPPNDASAESVLAALRAHYVT